MSASRGKIKVASNEGRTRRIECNESGVRAQHSLLLLLLCLRNTHVQMCRFSLCKEHQSGTATNLQIWINTVAVSNTGSTFCIHDPIGPFFLTISLPACGSSSFPLVMRHRSYSRQTEGLGKC